MKCNFECPFYYRYEYRSAYSGPIFFDSCRFHSTSHRDMPEFCDVPMQRRNKMKELLSEEV